MITHIAIFTGVLALGGTLYVCRNHIAQWVGDVVYQTLVTDRD